MKKLYFGTSVREKPLTVDVESDELILECDGFVARLSREDFLSFVWKVQRGQRFVNKDAGCKCCGSQLHLMTASNPQGEVLGMALLFRSPDGLHNIDAVLNMGKLDVILDQIL